jgi:hypothetical protein
MDWATFRAIFSKAHLVTLAGRQTVSVCMKNMHMHELTAMIDQKFEKLSSSIKFAYRTVLIRPTNCDQEPSLYTIVSYLQPQHCKIYIQRQE